MKTYIISDTHLNHTKIETYCDRPHDFTEKIVLNWLRTVTPQDLVIHIGDVFIGKAEGWKAIYPTLPGRKILIRGNHDWHHNCKWWMENGFDFACDAMIFRHIWFTHKPARHLPIGTHLNIHGHLHNIWHGFHKGEPETETTTRAGKLHNTWQRLFSIEYTDYKPVELEHFIAHPDKYQARGPVAVAQAVQQAAADADEKAERRRLRLQNHVCKPGCRCPKALANTETNGFLEDGHVRGWRVNRDFTI
jgi:calcineurin-like phosphoesterase family protein